MLPTIRSLLLRRRLLPIISATSRPPSVPRFFSSSGGGGGNDDSWSGKDVSDGGGGGDGEVLPGFDWGEVSSWSTGLTKDHFDGEAVVGRQVGSQADGAPRARSSERAAVALIDEEDEMVRMLEEDNKGNEAFVDGWNERMMETYRLLKQVREPGARGAYLKDSEKAEMYRLHKEDPETYTVERLAKDYRIMRQRVHAILWLKEMEEEEEKKLGKPLDDSVEILLDNFPE